MKRKCAHTGCITLLGSYSNDKYCFLHSRPNYTWQRDHFLEKLREDGIPPKGNLNCECGRVRKSNTSCVCKATPAPVPWGAAA